MESILRSVYSTRSKAENNFLNAALISANTAVELLLEEMDVKGEKATDAIENLQSVGKAV